MKIITTTKLLPTKEEAEILEKATVLLDYITSFSLSDSRLEDKVNKAYEALYALDEEIDYSLVKGVDEEHLNGKIENLFSNLVFEDDENEEEVFKSQYGLNP